MAFSDKARDAVEARARRLNHPETLALIARLKAAEIICRLCDEYEFSAYPGIQEALEVWHKTGGL